MSADPDEAVNVIAQAIRRYSRLHPDAADSVAGVQRWWLPPALHEEPSSLVQAALERLVRAGDMRSTRMEDGTVIYAAVRSRLS